MIQYASASAEKADPAFPAGRSLAEGEEEKETVSGHDDISFPGIVDRTRWRDDIAPAAVCPAFVKVHKAEDIISQW